MKRGILFSLLLLSSWMLTAQVGMYELAFGDSLAHCDSLVTAMGMYTNDKEGFTYLYYPLPESEQIDPIARIILYFDKYTKTLDGWCIYYRYPEQGNLEQEMMARIKALHGDAFEVRHEDYYGGINIYTWTLGSNHYLDIGNSGDVFHAYYYTK